MDVNTGYSGSDLSTLQRKRTVHEFRVKFPARNTLMKALEACFEESAYSAEPKCLFLAGDSGVGKTTLVDAFAALHPRVSGDEVDTVPVLVISIPAPATMKGVVSELLDALGDPEAHRGQLKGLTGRLIKLMKRAGVRMIILDEFQHLIDSESQKVLKRVADGLKSLLNRAKIPLVLVGMPESERILNDNPQLRRRFPRRKRLDRFGWDTLERRAEFRKVLQLIDQHLPFTQRAGFDEPETAAWFYERTGGTLGLVMMLAREATELAIDRGAACVERADLEAAFAQMHAEQNIDAKGDVGGQRVGKERRPKVKHRESVPQVLRQ